MKKGRYLNSPRRTPAVCPVCGEDVPTKAISCRECGADHRSGWNTDDTTYDGLDLPGETGDFDYDEFLREEFGAGAKTHRLKRLWWITAAVLLLAALVSLFLWGRILY